MTTPGKHDVFSANSVLTSYQVGALLQVNPSSVNKWIKDGRMPAFRTPGGHRRIRAADVVAFLATHEMPVPDSLRSAAKKRVLIVSQDASEREKLAGALAPFAQSVEALICQDGVEALIAVGRFLPEVVVLDAQMAYIDSIEVCRLLTASPSHKKLEIVMTTSDSSPDFERRALQAGARRCVVRPIDGGALLGLLGLAPETLLAG